MRYWIYTEPAKNSSHPVYCILSEDAIYESYWDYWHKQMVMVGKGAVATRERCIEDWVTVHWAWEATPENLLRLLDEDA